MRKTSKRVAIGLYAALYLGAASYLVAACTPDPFVRVSDNPPHAYRVGETMPVPAGCCDRGDELDLIMGASSGWVERCNNYGGRPVRVGELRVCRSVDF